jgi:stage IV sporulation protein B
MGLKQDVKVGDATIFTTVDGTSPKQYKIRIEKIDYNSNDTAKNMVIRITDPELISKTGGIVQGMSGSPIIQNGKLIGAVTHVFINDPAKGYGVFCENMFERGM